MISGVKSRVRPRESPRSPVSEPAWPRKLALARAAGTHESSKPECWICRSTWTCQSCSARAW
ncbi:MAG TPA: hypothetical protein PKA50_01145 [Gemmatimonadales bacterium]|nr:hypothetical protein [Gemmatimonadales bacterium]